MARPADPRLARRRELGWILITILIFAFLALIVLVPFFGQVDQFGTPLPTV